jgi:hypothetical protein
MTNEEISKEVVETENVSTLQDEVVEAEVVEAPKPRSTKKPAVEKDESPVDEAVVLSEELEEDKTPSSNINAAGTFVSPGADRTSKKEKTPELSEDKVALKSTKNVFWEGVGRVYKGYNIVTKEQAESWLLRSHITLATPEEIAREFNV